MAADLRVLKLLLCGLLLAGAAGCARRVERVEVPYFPPERGRELSYEDTRRVRTPETVQTYYAGRMPSKDRRTMREAGRVYRVVQDAAWDTRPLTQPLKGAGPVAGLRDHHYRPLDHDTRVRAEVLRQREIAAELQSRSARMGEAAEALRKRAEESEQERRVLEMLAAKLKEERGARAEAERELSELKASQSVQTGSAPVPSPGAPEAAENGAESLRRWDESKPEPETP